MTFNYVLYTTNRDTGVETTSVFHSIEDRLDALDKLDVHTHAFRMKEVPTEAQEAQHELF